MKLLFSWSLTQNCRNSVNIFWKILADFWSTLSKNRPWNYWIVRQFVRLSPIFQQVLCQFICDILSLKTYPRQFIPSQSITEEFISNNLSAFLSFKNFFAAVVLSISRKGFLGKSWGHFFVTFRNNVSFNIKKNKFVSLFSKWVFDITQWVLNIFTFFLLSSYILWKIKQVWN
jgi:hypothetical protein